MDHTNIVSFIDIPKQIAKLSIVTKPNISKLILSLVDSDKILFIWVIDKNGVISAVNKRDWCRAIMFKGMRGVQEVSMMEWMHVDLSIDITYNYALVKLESALLVRDSS